MQCKILLAIGMQTTLSTCGFISFGVVIASLFGQLDEGKETTDTSDTFNDLDSAFSSFFVSSKLSLLASSSRSSVSFIIPLATEDGVTMLLASEYENT